jgi:hypothetical protein
VARTTVVRSETPVLFVLAADSGAGIREAWSRLERAIGSLRGRRFVGAFEPERGEYRACVEALPGDDAGSLGLEAGTLPGGEYVRLRLRGEPPELYDRIPSAFEELVRAHEPDSSRPSLEVYRSRAEVDLLLPVR